MTLPSEREEVDHLTGSEVSYTSQKKRSNSDATEYPRRRATIACQICRLRKTRCNGARPKCQLCTDLDAECIYREPGIKLDAGDKLILDHLARIEGLLHSNLIQRPGSQHLSHLTNSTSPATSNDTTNEETIPIIQHSTQTQTPITIPSSHASISNPHKISAGLGSWTNPPPNTSISTMPRVHTTPALHLLQWPLIRDLVSRPYDPQNLLQLEMAREPLPLTPSPNPPPSLTNTSAKSSIKSFFTNANIWYAVINPYTWARYYRIAISQQSESAPGRSPSGPICCLVYLVLALGVASENGSIAFQQPDNPAGIAYFTTAWAMIPSIMTSNTPLAAQCMVLASAYLFYLVRPLEAWSLLSNVSLKLQLLLGGNSAIPTQMSSQMSMSTRMRIPGQWKELIVRVYWNALLFESDLLAELDLPISGIIHFEEMIDLPGSFEEEVEDDEYQNEIESDSESEYEDQDHDHQGNQINTPLEQDELWYFLSEIALRRLLNRVSHLIYQRPRTQTLSTLTPIVSELDYQLSQWYDSLPGPVKFPLSHQPSNVTNINTTPLTPIQTVLRHRYNACRTIIYRPYILAVLSSPSLLSSSSSPSPSSSLITEYCRRCLTSTLSQLSNISSHRLGHLPYLWQGALSMVSQSLLIMGASMCPSLRNALPELLDLEDIQRVVKGVVTEVGFYAHLAPSLRLAGEILNGAEGRWRGFIRDGSAFTGT